MESQRITVFGGTGFLGSRIARRLVAYGWEVRVAARHPKVPERVTPEAPVELMETDIRSPDDVRTAVRGVAGAINAVSLYQEHDDLTFQDIHVDGAERIAACAREEGLERLVHVSGIGSDPESESRYVAARGLGEQRVREAFPDSIILRPSVLFGPGDSFLQALDGITRAPVVPMFGRGATRLQPAFVEDVVSGIGQSLVRTGVTGKVFELGGGKVYTYREILQVILAHRQRRRLLLPVPFPIWRALAGVAERLPGQPLTVDQVMLMEHDNTVGSDLATFADLGIHPASIEDRIAVSLP
ncbi:complex I NDUFA9 subunit family protein [Thiohalorhabdus sp. Cl-TMA]|uniref:Complex I NDUFA9 subunit family protein n=1 Tax=Thiohalorhabdus methylotrophus TaxID=3242694 RepID=A0ABV4TXW4_9GAMM